MGDLLGKWVKIEAETYGICNYTKEGKVLTENELTLQEPVWGLVIGEFWNGTSNYSVKIGTSAASKTKKFDDATIPRRFILLVNHKKILEHRKEKPWDSSGFGY